MEGGGDGKSGSVPNLKRLIRDDATHIKRRWFIHKYTIILFCIVEAKT